MGMFHKIPVRVPQLRGIVHEAGRVRADKILVHGRDPQRGELLRAVQKATLPYVAFHVILSKVCIGIMKMELKPHERLHKGEKKPFLSKRMPMMLF